jgi:hypothetical protein
VRASFIAVEGKDCTINSSSDEVEPVVREPVSVGVDRHYRSSVFQKRDEEGEFWVKKRLTTPQIDTLPLQVEGTKILEEFRRVQNDAAVTLRELTAHLAVHLAVVQELNDDLIDHRRHLVMADLAAM